MARKVLECCPIQEPWTKEQIATEMRRSGSGAQVPVIQGCLDTLRGMGLIKEPERGKFVRVIAKPKAEVTSSPVLKAVHPMSTMKQVQPTPDPISRMAELAEQARAIAKEIESVALERAGTSWPWSATGRTVSASAMTSALLRPLRTIRGSGTRRTARTARCRPVLRW